MSSNNLEYHFTDKLLKFDFEPIAGWECLLILSVSVDDFNLVGKKESPKEGWKLITGSGLVLDPPTPLGDYPGCGQFPDRVFKIELSPCGLGSFAHAGHCQHLQLEGVAISRAS